MYKAKITNKSYEDGILTFNVEFSDGVTSRTEQVQPQDESGLKLWVESRLIAFNAGKEVSDKYSEGDVIDVTKPVVTPPKPTQAELDRDAWLNDHYLWVRVKTTLIDTGILTGTETEVKALQDKVKNGFRAEYIDNL
jgi:hypothetical protein